MKRWIFVAILTVLAGVLIYVFLFGRFFPFSPLIIGFDKHEFKTAVIYDHNHIDINRFQTIDDLVKRTEQFHGMSFRRKVEIFICDTMAEYQRLSGTTARCNAQPLYGRIFVSSKAMADDRNGIIDLQVYLRHELSHALLYQNISLFHVPNLPKWFLEGTAMASAGQIGKGIYDSKNETYRIIRNGHFLAPDDYGTMLVRARKSVKNLPVPGRIGFIYSEFGCIVEDLITRYGQERFQDLIRDLMRRGRFGQTFQQNYQMSFTQYLKLFQSDIAKALP